MIDNYHRELIYNDNDFEEIRALIYQCAGITLADHKKDFVYNRLIKRIKYLAVTSFDEYIKLLHHSTEEIAHFINAMTTNLTSFYREQHHFDYLSDTYFPSLYEKGQRKLRVWSSACSVGEEPYSIALSLLESNIDLNEWDIKILATDINTDALATAKTGVYQVERIDGLNLTQKKLGFMRGVNHQMDKVMVKKSLQDLIDFKYCNLIESWDIEEPLDIIFCRNVMIYFDKKTQKTLLERMAKLLKPGGILFIGHSESLNGSMKEFDMLGRTIYQKTKH